MIEKHPTHISFTCHCHMPLSFSHRCRKLFNIYEDDISYLKTQSLITMIKDLFVDLHPLAISSNVCMQDLKLIRVTSNYMKNLLIYQFDPTS